MSVLIKGIDMPKEGGMTAIKIWPNGHVEVLIGFPMSNHPEVILEGARMNRKAVGIPTPHGRLIDADALLKGKSDHDTISTHEIWNAPTVVESEE